MATFFTALTFSGLVVAVLCTIAVLRHALMQGGRAKRRLGAYLPDHVAEEIMKRKDDRPMARAHPAVTIAVFRVKNYSQMVEHATPEQALRYLNECYLLCGTAVLHNKGTVERLLEDGMVAVFGIGNDTSSEHEYRGVRAALEASRLFASMASRWESEGHRAFRIGVGVHSGSVVAGDVGFGDRRSFALVGGSVITAYRLQEMADAINASVLCSGETYDAVEARFSAVPVKQMPLRQTHDLHDTYIVRGLANGETVEELKLPTAPVLVTAIEEPKREISVPEPKELAMPKPVAAALAPGRFDRNADDKPIMPDPIWPNTYEDGSGPPFRLGM